MANVNKFICIGTLTRDPELRVTPKGTAIGQFALAVNRKWKDGENEKEEVCFLDFEVWGKSAEAIAKYVSKGQQIYIEARAKQDTWEDKESGKKRSKIKFVVENFQFLGGKKKEEGGGSSDRSAAPTPKPAPSSPDDDESVPF
jgi:single-strand DNA-binding protein